MKIIKCLSEYIEEELDDSEKYILKAMEYKEDWPEVAGTLYVLSLEEMKHMQLIHDQVTKIIENYRKEKGEPPEAMMAIYEYLHKKFIRKAKEIKIMQSMYNE